MKEHVELLRKAAELEVFEPPKNFGDIFKMMMQEVKKDDAK